MEEEEGMKRGVVRCEGRDESNQNAVAAIESNSVPSFRFLAQIMNKKSSDNTSEHEGADDIFLHDIEVTGMRQEGKSTFWFHAKEELFSNPTKTALFVLFTLFMMASFIFCAVALKYGISRNSRAGAVAPLNLLKASPFPTMSPSTVPSMSPSSIPSMSSSSFPSTVPSSVPSLTPSTSSLRNTDFVPSGAPSRRLPLFGPSLYAPVMDPNGCPLRPTPPPLPGKKGVAFTLRPPGQKGSWVENLPKVKALNAYWNYSWGPQRIVDQPTNMEFTPMIWGKWNVPTFLKDHVIPQMEDDLAFRLLGFNEPDKEKQANMSVDEAIKLWPLLEDTGLSLVSPSCADPMGPWMEEFMARANELCYRVDWIGVHWYGGPNASSFQTRMKAIYEKFGKPIMITEFAPADWAATTVQNNRFSPQAVLSFAQEVLPWLEQQPWIVGYAWFSFNIDQPEGTSSALFDLNGAMTPLGQYYASVRTK